MQKTNFSQTQTILKALEFALAKGGFAGNSRQKRTALALIKSMRSNESLSGRHQQLVNLLRKGASIEEMIKATGSSRRTVFRYLNQFEDAGVNLELASGKYRLNS